jgi:hypothetical protein
LVFVVCVRVQVVIVPITKKDTDRASVMAAVDKLHAALKAAGIRVKVRSGYSNAGICTWPMHADVNSYQPPPV